MTRVCVCLKHPGLFTPSSNAALSRPTCTADQDQTATDVQMRTRSRLSVSERGCASVKLTDGFGWNFKEETESRHLAASSESFLFQLRRRLIGETGLTNMTDSSKIQLCLSSGHTEA